MADSKARGIGTIINRAARFAVGAGTAGDTAQSIATGGVANAGTSLSFGEKIRGGLSAISPDFRALEQIQSNINLQSSQVNRNNALAAQDQLKTEAANKPFDISRIIGAKDPTGSLAKKIQPILQRAGIDKDGNGIVSDAELQEGLRSGQINLGEISKVLGETASGVDKQIGTIQAEIDSRKETLGITIQGLTSTFTDEEFLSNPTLVEKDKQLATLIQRKQAVTSQKESLVAGNALVGKFQADVEAQRKEDRTATEQKTDIINSKAFTVDLRDGRDEIAKNPKNEDDVIFILSQKYGMASDEVRRRLRTGRKITEFDFTEK